MTLRGESAENWRYPLDVYRLLCENLDDCPRRIVYRDRWGEKFKVLGKKVLRALSYRLTLIVLAVLLVPNGALGVSAEEQGLDRGRLAQVVETVGVIRYFHPHEAVTTVDWNRVLHDGFELALRSGDDTEFSASLGHMLGSIGSGITHNPESQPSELSCTSSERPVRWVHEGLGASPAPGRQGPYSSQRTGIQEQQINSRASAVVAMGLDAADFRGEQLLFEGEARVPGGGEAALWIRVDDADRKTLAFYNMDDRRFNSVDWTSRGLIVSVENQAEAIHMGMIVYGDVSAQFRRVRLQVYDQGNEKPIGDSLLPPSDQWRFTPALAEFELDSNQTSAGVEVSVTAKAEAYLPSQQVVDQLDQSPTSWTVELIDGSKLQVPIALCPAQAGLDATARERLVDRFPPIEVDKLTAAEQARLDVATLWPVMQHFYPYRDTMDGWPDALARALEQADSVEDREVHQQLLQRLMAEVEDGHARVYETDPDLEEDTAWLPISALKLGRNLVITGVASSDVEITAGDRIVAIDGEPIEDWMEQARALHSGSPQWRTHRAIQAMLVGIPGSRRSFQLERNGQVFEVSLQFERDRQLGLSGRGHAPVMPDGIAYVDLRGLNDEQWAERLPDVLSARGVVFDLRGYPGPAGFTILSHLLTSKDDFTGWMNVLAPRTPDGDLITASTLEWGVEPKEPRIEAPAVFLTDQRAISQAESVLGVVKYHQLGTIVGSNTAGANGDILPLMLPGGFTVLYTGMRVLGPDGQPFHARGIEPDIRVQPTAEDVSKGRDEVLERALLLLRNPPHA